MNQNPEPESRPPDPRLIEKIRILNDLPGRDPRQASQGKAAFLAAAQEMAGAAAAGRAPAKIAGVSPDQKRRHSGWMQAILNPFTIRRKEQSPMFTLISTLLIVASLALTGGGAAVAAAQTSQPEQALYGLKIFSEDARLELEGDPAEAYQLALAFAERRAFEIQTMLQAGGVPPESVQARYQAQVEQAIQYALNQPDEQAVPALEQVRTRLQTQDQAMQQIRASGLPDVEAILLRTRAMVQERLQWVETGLRDPAQLREQLRLRDQSGAPLQPGPGEPAGGLGPGSNPGPGDGECPDCTPAYDGQGSQNPWTTGTPVPGSGYGPGPGDGKCPDCTPAYDGQGSQNPWTTVTPVPGSGYGPGPGDGDCAECTPAYDGDNSQNPWTTSTPVPGSGYGPGPGDGDCAECTPAYDGDNSQNPWTTNTPVPGSGYGPGPGDGDCADCTPASGPGPQPTPVPPQLTQAGPQPTQAGPGGKP